MRRLLERESGQMAVELAVVLPIIFIVLVIAVDCMTFVSECARFDNIAAQKTLARAVSPNRSNYDEGKRLKNVRRAVAAEFKGPGEKVKLTQSDAGEILATMTVYEFEFSMAPWPLGGSDVKVFGMRIPTRLTHTYKFAFDPYTPGQLL